MSWVASNIFVRGSEQRSVGEALATLLADHGELADHELLGDRPPPLIVSPPIGGWVAISGASGWFRDFLELARQLSASCETTTLSCELAGHAYRLRLCEQVCGERKSLRATPPLDWDSDHEHRGPMPLYDDVEQRAYVALRQLAVPASLVLLGVSPLGDHPPAELGQALQLTLDRGEVASSTRTLRGIAYGVDEPPVVPRDCSTEVGVTLFDERYVEGKPTDAAVDRLVALEEALLDRAQHARPEKPVGLTLTYHGGSYQDQLDAMLRARGRHVPPRQTSTRAPWWQFWRAIGRGHS